ncbi:MAG: porin family protein [Caulobacterales bacterium]|nr:porin family protein [Caulobacterales bacterium]
MKNALIAAASLAAIGIVVPACANAQDAAAVNTGAYGNLNLGYTDAGQANIWGVQGRLGYRFNNWLGAEGELGTGLKGDNNTVAGDRVHTKLRHEEAIYGVGFLPVAPGTDILARVGYGNSRIKVNDETAGFSDAFNYHSWNYGVGAQHLFDGANGIRADFTRQEFTHDRGHANVWTVGYVRKF